MFFLLRRFETFTLECGVVTFRGFRKSRFIALVSGLLTSFFNGQLRFITLVIFAGRLISSLSKETGLWSFSSLFFFIYSSKVVFLHLCLVLFHPHSLVFLAPLHLKWCHSLNISFSCQVPPQPTQRPQQGFELQIKA